MLGQLPKALTVNGKSYAIRTDFRNILRIFEAFADPKLTDNDKLYICLKRIYIDFAKIPRKDFKEAYEQAHWFLGCGLAEEKRPPMKTFNWVKDAPIIFPAVNKVAGKEVREVDYMHWWTFMGYFQSIDSESLFGTVLSIRQKKAKGKKLEKYEKEFCNNNKALMALDDETVAEHRKSAEDQMQAIFNELLKGGE